jgi:recombination protein RecT
MNALIPYEEFAREVAAREEELEAILPPNISREKFVTTAIVAVKQNPDLLTKCTRKSLHEAVMEAAEDGLLPDGREGAIVAYASEAQWSPMIYGLRKRAMELSGMIIDSQVVYANDHFVWHQGDDPRIEHTPAPLGQDRGRMIGAYALFRRDGQILHREVMDRAAIEITRNQSKGWQKSLMWTKFESEAWRKTVVRRGIKTVPCVPALERMIGREDRNFSFAPGLPQSSAPIDTRDVPSAPRTLEATTIDEIADDGAAGNGPPTADVSCQGNTKAPPASAVPAQSEAFLKALQAAETPTALNQVWEMFGKKFRAADLAWATDQFESRLNSLTE